MPSPPKKISKNFLKRFRFTPVISPISEGVIYCRPQRITSITFRAMSAGKEQTIQQAKLNTDYTDRNSTSTPFYHEGGQTATETHTFTRRIGPTVYRVSVHFSRTSNETMNDKINRLVKNDFSGKAANQ